MGVKARRERRRDPKTGTANCFWRLDIRYRTADGERRHYRPKADSRLKEDAIREGEAMLPALQAGTFGRKEVPTFEKWFEGRFWTEWVIAQRNKPAEQEAKRSVYRCYLRERFGRFRLDDIAKGNHVAQFKAALMKRVDAGTLSLKSVNNILAVLSKALRYAEDARVIERAPRVKLYKVERPEIEAWEIDEYARILEAARKEGPEWHMAVCLAGEAGLRIGEVRELTWERDVDLIAGTLTVNLQTRKGITGTPKGRTRRSVPMTATLLATIKDLDVVRRGYVVRNPDGSPLRDGQTIHAMPRICRKAGLPERGWHSLRHSFGTHAALFGVNPWTLQIWMGHKRIDETMRYVHVAEEHRRDLPGPVVRAAAIEDSTRRIVAMLGARAAVEPVSLVEDQPRKVHAGCTTPGGFRESVRNC